MIDIKVKEVESLERFIEILQSMRNPQVKYEVTELDSEMIHVSIRIMNERGIYLYTYGTENSVKKLKPLLDFLEDSPIYWFRVYFETHFGVIEL